MTKQELINAINSKVTSHYDAGVSKIVIEAVLASLANVVTEAVAKGEEVTLPGLGKLFVKVRAARKGRNPATGKELDIPAKNAPKFTPAKALKDAVE